ncbi:MAG: ABC transporter ATP-binding protein/permease [Chloroflexi bacterium]|nr:ABC transporter ATP-binding protein/permease [Chloroflexota bacterium]MCC6894684.1 ABC transporter ATP-binding protein [Anaerolineae bacterium]
MGFIMDGLDAEAYDRKYSDSTLVKRIVQYFKPETKRMALISAVIVLASLVNTGLPIFISNGLDNLQKDTSTSSLLLLTAGIVALGVLGWLFNAIRQWFSAAAIGNVTLQLREDAFDAVVKRDLSFYDTYSSGKVVSRVTSDTQAFSQVVALVTDLASQILLVILLIGYLFLVNAQLTLITLALAPFIVATALAFRKIARETVTQSRRINAVVSSHIQETISGIGIAKAFRQEQTIYTEFLDVNAQSYRVNLRSGYTFSSIFPILNLLAGVGTAALVYFGGAQVQSGVLTAGEWYLFIQGLSLFWFPLTSIASFWSQFQQGLAAGERVFGLIDAEAKVVQTDNKPVKEVKGDIRFEHMNFRYTDDVPVLKDFSLTIPAGETLALVGHTGSGKSSIGKLIARFYEFQEGQLLIDGQDIRTFDLRSYREKLGVVTQTPFLFDGTIMDNIRYGNPNATDAEVERAAKLVGHGDWIDTLPNGLQTQVGERGGSLSMGQRQLVSLARVMLQNPSIFILDEATASIDPLTETLIQEGLDIVLDNRTSIVIAHRLSTIKNADRIIVLREGEIIEEGTHDTLLKDGGHYAELYNTYFRHQSLEYIENAKNVLNAV